MTKVYFYKQNNKFVAIKAQGHADYADFGKDIVCAAISTAIQTCIHGMLMVVNIKGFYLKRDEDKGDIEFKLPKNLNQESFDKCQLLFETMYATLLDIQDGYPKNLLMEVIEDVY